MHREYWHRQGAEPLFPQLEWSRPENRQQAGKLLIVGGNTHGFAMPAEAYNDAVKAGIGTATVLLPDTLKKTVGPILEHGEYAPSTPSGSFARAALADLDRLSEWSDGVLFAGDLGRNAETAILLEKYLAGCETRATLTKDAVDYVTSLPQLVLQRPNTLLVLSFAQLQRLGTAARFEIPLTYGMDLLRLVDWLHDFTRRYAPHIIVKHNDTIFTAVNEEVSTTRLLADMKFWRLKTASYASVWWLQHHMKAFEALTTAVHSVTAA